LTQHHAISILPNFSDHLNNRKKKLENKITPKYDRLPKAHSIDNFAPQSEREVELVLLRNDELISVSTQDAFRSQTFSNANTQSNSVNRKKIIGLTPSSNYNAIDDKPNKVKYTDRVLQNL
jgi:hypothetical protein